MACEVAEGETIDGQGRGLKTKPWDVPTFRDKAEMVWPVNKRKIRNVWNLESQELSVLGKNRLLN